MKFLALFLLLLPTLLQAQGGIGNKPRTDIVMLPQAVRDSLADEITSHINDLKRYAEGNMIDSAAQWIAFNGNADKSGRWSRAMNATDSAERVRVQTMLDKARKLFHEYPEMKPQYFAVFKTADAPSGQKDLYQIHHVNGNKKKMVSWTYYPVGDKLLLGDF